MALGWIALLKTVPWADVISAAPQVAGGARKLWDAVGKKSPTLFSPGNVGGEGTASINLRIDQNEAAVVALHDQMLSASEIIAKLADQNTFLVAKIENLRERMLWLSTATAATLLITVGSLVIATR